jgi:hypothetical protein
LGPGADRWHEPKFAVGEKLYLLFEERNPGYNLGFRNLGLAKENLYIVVYENDKDESIVAKSSVEVKAVFLAGSGSEIERDEEGVFYKGKFIGTTDSFCESDNLKKTYYLGTDSEDSVPRMDKKLTMSRCDLPNHTDGKPSGEVIILR